MECSDSALSLLFTDDREMRKLNITYRGKDKPTDVLSFAALDVTLPTDLKPKTCEKNLGDIVISIDTLVRQAQKFGVTQREELLRLLIHGTLHLLGYDHENVPKSEADRMRAKENALMKQLSL